MWRLILLLFLGTVSCTNAVQANYPALVRLVLWPHWRRNCTLLGDNERDCAPTEQPTDDWHTLLQQQHGQVVGSEEESSHRSLDKAGHAACAYLNVVRQVVEASGRQCVARWLVAGHTRSYSTVLLRGAFEVLHRVGILSAMELVLSQPAYDHLAVLTGAYAAAVDVSDECFHRGGSACVPTAREPTLITHAVENVATAVATCAVGVGGEAVKQLLFTRADLLTTFQPRFTHAASPSAATRAAAVRTALDMVAPLLTLGTKKRLSCGFKIFPTQTHDGADDSGLVRQAHAESFRELAPHKLISLRRAGALDAYVSTAFAWKRHNYSHTDHDAITTRFRLSSRTFMDSWVNDLDTWYDAARDAVGEDDRLDLVSEEVLGDPVGAMMRLAKFVVAEQVSDTEWDQIRQQVQTFVDTDFVEGDPHLERERTMNIVRNNVKNWDQFAAEVHEAGGDEYMKEWSG